MRSLLRYLESVGETISASSEPTGIEWLIDSGLDWVQAWPHRHTVAPAPALVTKDLQKHAWKEDTKKFAFPIIFFIFGSPKQEK